MRRYDWQIEFSSFVRERARRPFEWGSNDCCLFAADAVQAMTGVDHAAALRGYTSAREAARVVAANGGLRKIASEALGAEISPLLAGVGDLVLVENAGRELLAICNGGTALAPGEEGTVVVSMESARAAWRV